MTEREALLETACAMYYRGSLEILDLLSRALADMPNQNERLSVREYADVIATARKGVVMKSQDKFDPEELIRDVTK